MLVQHGRWQPACQLGEFIESETFGFPRAHRGEQLRRVTRSPSPDQQADGKVGAAFLGVGCCRCGQHASRDRSARHQQVLDRADELEPTVVALMQRQPRVADHRKQVGYASRALHNSLVQQRKMGHLDDSRPRRLGYPAQNLLDQPCQHLRAAGRRGHCCRVVAHGHRPVVCAAATSQRLGDAERAVGEQWLAHRPRLTCRQHDRRGPAASGRPKPLGLSLRDREPEALPA